MTREKKLQDLLELARLKADLALAPLAEGQAKLAQQQSRVDALARHRELLSVQQPSDPVLAGLMARQAERLRQGQARGLQKMAEAQAQLEILKAQARPAVGRRHALEALIEKQEKAAAMVQRRNAGRSGFP